VSQRPLDPWLREMIRDLLRGGFTRAEVLAELRGQVSIGPIKQEAKALGIPDAKQSGGARPNAGRPLGSHRSALRARILELHAEKVPALEIAAQTGASRAYVYRVISEGREP